MRIICDQLCQILQVNAQSSHCNTQIKRLKTEVETGLLKKKDKQIKKKLGIIKLIFSIALLYLPKNYSMPLELKGSNNVCQ